MIAFDRVPESKSVGEQRWEYDVSGIRLSTPASDSLCFGLSEQEGFWTARGLTVQPFKEKSSKQSINIHGIQLPRGWR